MSQPHSGQYVILVRTHDGRELAWNGLFDGMNETHGEPRYFDDMPSWDLVKRVQESFDPETFPVEAYIGKIA